MAAGAGGFVVVIDWWNRQSPSGRRWMSIGGVVLSLIVMFGVLNSLGRAPSGKPLSSYATTNRGLAAFEELLATTGHRTEQLRDDLDKTTIPTNATVVAIGSYFSEEETAAIDAFVRAGGRMIVGGFEGAELVSDLTQEDVEWRPGGGPEPRVATVLRAEGVRRVVTDGAGTWLSSHGEALLTADDGVMAVAIPLGNGSLIALADPSMLTNALLARADNAAFGVAIVGEGRPVTFSEAGHGYGPKSGIAALPDRWKAALWFAAIAALVGALAAGKRLGPADVEPETPAPPRVLYVTSLAATLVRGKDPVGAGEPLQRRARDLLAQRTGRRDLDDGAAVAAAARSLGLTEPEAASLVAPTDNDEQLLVLARAVSHLEEP